jgi:hypothetical protein
MQVFVARQTFPDKYSSRTNGNASSTAKKEWDSGKENQVANSGLVNAISLDFCPNGGHVKSSA